MRQLFLLIIYPPTLHSCLWGFTRVTQISEVISPRMVFSSLTVWLFFLLFCSLYIHLTLLWLPHPQSVQPNLSMVKHEGALFSPHEEHESGKTINKGRQGVKIWHCKNKQRFIKKKNQLIFGVIVHVNKLCRASKTLLNNNHSTCSRCARLL